MAEGGMHGRGTCVSGQGACVAEGGGGMCGRGCMPHVPPHYDIRSVNARAVRILLECIPVVFAETTPQGYHLC